MQHLHALGSQVALWQYLCHCLLTSLSWLPCLMVSLSPGVRCSTRHFLGAPALGPFRFSHADSALSWIVAGMPMVCPLCLGLLVPWVGCLVLVSLEPVCACLQHPSRTGFPLPDIITPCCKSSLHFGQTIRAWFKWLVVFTGTLGLERCRCALWLHPPPKASPWVWLPSLWVPNFRCALDLQHSQSSRVTPEGCTGVWSPCRLQPCCLLLAGGACCPRATCCRKCRYSAAVL